MVVLLSEPVVDPIASGYLIQTSPKLRYPGKRLGFAVNAAASHSNSRGNVPRAAASRDIALRRF
jgi:hypothetical protein